VDNKTVELWSAATKVSAGERRRFIIKEYCSLYLSLIGKLEDRCPVYEKARDLSVDNLLQLSLADAVATIQT
jgi:hypothetical protein